jgi:hypothetical protein
MSNRNFFQFSHAKSGGCHRQSFGMPAQTPLLVLVALCATASCFTPEYHCRITCSEQRPGCPNNFKCDFSANLCARDGIADACLQPNPMRPAPDAAVDTSSDAPPAHSAPPDVQPGDVSDPPGELCYANSCFPLSPETRKALVLWLDPSNLPAPDAAVARWGDRSGKGNDALALSPESRPRSRGDGVRLEPGAGGSMRILHAASLDFEASDFAILVVARLSATPPSCLFKKSASDRMDTQGVAMEWAYSTPLKQTMFAPSVNNTVLETGRTGLGDLAPHVFVLRRSGNSLEARVDGTPAGDVGTLNPPGQSVSNTSHAFLGGCGTTSPTISTVHAAVALKGEVPLSELAKLEGFLSTAFPR